MIFKEKIELVKTINFKSFLEKIEGYTFKKEGNNYYRCHEHTSLILKERTPGQYVYAWSSVQQCGDIIQYVRENIIGDSFKNTIDYLLKYMNIDTERYDNTFTNNNEIIEKECNNTIDIEYSSNTRQTYAYLHKSRLIDISIINEFIAKGLIKQDLRNNAVLVHLNFDNKIVGADLQGTNSYKKFKGVIKNSNRDYGFSFKIGENIDKIYIFEAGIDMLSYYQLYKSNLNDCLLLSTGGSQKINKIATYLNKYDNISTIYVAVDNDDAGNIALQKIKDIYNNKLVIDNREELIKYNIKDYNDLLKLKTEKMKKVA
ncbi:LtrC-like protein [Clostridium bornimense]|uniref:LtrC-like protein n=1 Tax=Clostridium bornimense TaxID=1216932 RepID=W6RVS9_9CLOT|nr:DUF3991 and TOPRIM domain-containing protein [Clostridium bornimense]CDM68428.1 LtrC-like protein [Clostridium bornimense]